MAIPKYDRHGNLKNTSNPEYEGYMVDLIAEISKIVGFKYSLVRERENKYGHRTPQHGWDGIIGAVLDKVRYTGGLRPRQRKRTAFKTETLIAPSFVSTPDSFLWRQLPTITTRSFLLFLAGSLFSKF